MRTDCVWNLDDFPGVPDGPKVVVVNAGMGVPAFAYRYAGYQVVGCAEEDSDRMAVCGAALGGVESSDDPERLDALNHADVMHARCRASFSFNRRKDDPEELLRLASLAVGHQLVLVLEASVKMLEDKGVGYCGLVRDILDEAGYEVQFWKTDARTAGVCQKREDAWILARPSALCCQDVRLDWKAPPPTFRQLCGALPFQDLYQAEESGADKLYWERTPPGSTYVKASDGKCVGCVKLPADACCPHLKPSSVGKLAHPLEMRQISWVECAALASVPLDVELGDVPYQERCRWLLEAVPCLLTARIAKEVANRWLGGSVVEIPGSP